MTFPDATFDLVLADNVFEHFTEPEAVMKEAYRVLRPGGGMLIPVFSSILSKYGLHLKHGLKMPWANVLFSERTIIRAMRRLADVDPNLFELYPGLADSPQRVRDLRRYKDLNDITYREFKAMTARTGFKLETFSIYSTRLGKLLIRVPIVPQYETDGYSLDRRRGLSAQTEVVTQSLMKLSRQATSRAAQPGCYPGVDRRVARIAFGRPPGRRSWISTESTPSTCCCRRFMWRPSMPSATRTGNRQSKSAGLLDTGSQLGLSRSKWPCAIGRQRVDRPSPAQRTSCSGRAISRTRSFSIP